MTPQKKVNYLNISLGGVIFLAVEAFIFAILYTRLFN